MLKIRGSILELFQKVLGKSTSFLSDLLFSPLRITLTVTCCTETFFFPRHSSYLTPALFVFSFVFPVVLAVLFAVLFAAVLFAVLFAILFAVLFAILFVVFFGILKFMG
jgi:hypothetical protein